MTNEKKETNIKKGFFSTRDLYLASTLVTFQFFMTGVDYQIEGERHLPVGYFKFEDTPELRETIKKYNQGLLKIEPRQFITNMRSLKAEVNNEYKSPHKAIKKE